MGAVLREESVWVTDLGVRVSDFKVSDWVIYLSEWVSGWASLRGWSEAWVSESAWLRVFQCVLTLRVFEWEWGIWKCVFGIQSVDFESYKLDFYVAKFAPRGKFVHVRVSQKHWNRALEAWVLI